MTNFVYIKTTLPLNKPTIDFFCQSPLSEECINNRYKASLSAKKR
jgi:hypothetical protein